MNATSLTRHSQLGGPYFILSDPVPFDLSSRVDLKPGISREKRLAPSSSSLNQGTDF